MNLTKGKFIQKIVAVLIVMVMTLADFSIIGENVISYALDMVATNSNNVEFSAYFIKEVEGKQQMLTETESAINSNDLKLFVEISVKNEGYFNGILEMPNSSLKFIKAKSNEFVKTLEDNKVILNKINAGITAKIEFNIAYINSNEIKVNSLSQDSEIKLTGKYTSSEKEVQIDGTTTVKVNWKSPEDIKANLNTKVLTNSKYEIVKNEIEKANKRIVQLLIDSKLDNNTYPIEETIIELNVPEGADEVKVHSRSTYATNGNENFSNNNYNYSKESNKLTINLKNEETNGMIDWNKGVTDTLVVTLTYPEEKKFNEEKINTNVVIKTYDGKEVKESSETVISKDIDGIVSNEIIEEEKSIYKGKIYTGEERQYTSTTVLNIDYSELVKDVKIVEKEAEFKNENEAKTSNIQYVETRISKAEFDKIIGSSGHISILDQDGKDLFTVIDGMETRDGNIVLKYKEGVKSIIILTSNPLVNGTLNFVHTKAIKDAELDRDDIRELTKIAEEVNIGYNDNQQDLVSVKNEIILKETSSKANIKINKEKLSTIKTNENVEIVATLETNDESKDLYNSPTVNIVFPKEIEEVHVSQAEALYKNGLKVSRTNQDKNSAGNIILTVEFENEQKKYDSEIINGLELHFKADIVVDKLTPSKEVNIKMQYTNENGIEGEYETSTNVYLESKYGLMLYNKIENYNANNEVVETVDDNEYKARLDISKENVTAEVTTMIINNYSHKIENLTLIGNLLSESEKDSIEAIVSDLSINDSGIQVFYNKNAGAKDSDNNWTEEKKDAKAYKILIRGIEPGDTFKLSYKLNIEDNLSYNLESNLSTILSYKYGESNITTKSSIVLETEEAIIEENPEDLDKEEDGFVYNILATSGNKQLSKDDKIFNGETIKYRLKITNNTGKDYTNATIKVKLTNGVILRLVETEVYNPLIYDGEGYGVENYWKITDEKEINFGNISLKNGESTTVQYQVVVNKVSGDDIYSNIIITTEDNKELSNLETDKLSIKEAELKLLFIPALSEECVWKTNCVQQSNLFITNTSKSDLKNIEVKITLSKGLSCEDADDYISSKMEDGTEFTIKSKEINSLGQTIITLQIANIASNTTAELYVRPYISEIKENKADVGFYATAVTESKNEYTSNFITRQVEQVKKHIKVNQLVKINEKNITKSTIIKDGDKLDFYITVKNEDLEKAKLIFYNYIQNGLDVKNITYINNAGNKTDITNIYNDSSISYELILQSGEESTIIVSTIVNAIYMLEQKCVKNEVTIIDIETGAFYDTSVEYEVDTKKFEQDNVPEEEPGEEDFGTIDGEDENQDNNDNEGSEDPSDSKKHTIKGVAWIDSNKNGEREETEELVSNMELIAIDTESASTIITKTNTDGSYELNLPEAKYILAFMYDNENYYVTTYKADGVNSKVNSDVVAKTMNIDNQEITVAATDIINLTKDKSNIDIGLIYRNKFDLKIEKTVSKIVVTNDSGTKTYKFEEEDLAKVEIAAKKISGSTVVVEYKLKVINVGDIDGYVKNIVDYMPADMVFNSTLNKGWYQSDKYLYNETIADEMLRPGESCEVDLVLIKTMTGSNTGLVNNTAKIESSYNDSSAKDVDIKNDTGSADVIISVKTGVAIKLTLLTISFATTITAVAYYITKRYIIR